MKPIHSIGNSIWTCSRDEVLQVRSFADRNLPANLYLKINVNLDKTTVLLTMVSVNQGTK